jgi:hypothetical protein
MTKYLSILRMASIVLALTVIACGPTKEPDRVVGIELRCLVFPKDTGIDVWGDFCTTGTPDAELADGSHSSVGQIGLENRRQVLTIRTPQGTTYTSPSISMSRLATCGPPTNHCHSSDPGFLEGGQVLLIIDIRASSGGRSGPPPGGRFARRAVPLCL